MKGLESDDIKKVIANGAPCTTIDVGVGGEPTAWPTCCSQPCEGNEFTVESIHRYQGQWWPYVQPGSGYVESSLRPGGIDAVIGIAGGNQIAPRIYA